MNFKPYNRFKLHHVISTKNKYFTTKNTKPTEREKIKNNSLNPDPWTIYILLRRIVKPFCFDKTGCISLNLYNNSFVIAKNFYHIFLSYFVFSYFRVFVIKKEESNEIFSVRAWNGNDSWRTSLFCISWKDEVLGSENAWNAGQHPPKVWFCANAYRVMDDIYGERVRKD